MYNSLKRNSEFHRLYLYFIKGKWLFFYMLLIIKLTNFWWCHVKAIKHCSGLCSGLEPFEVVFMMKCSFWLLTNVC